MVFIIPLGLIWMTTIPQDTINSITHFVQIVLKILASHLQDQAKLFLDNIKV